MMNERIKELAEQADDYADNKIQMPGEYHPDWHDIRDEKFAELIVAECIDVVGKATASPNGYQALMKHFGIEE
jgi:hypothetical protein